MKQFRAASYLVASDVLERERGCWDAIVILGSAAEVNPWVAERSRRHLVLYFDDIERPLPGQRPFGETHIKQALAFAKDSERLLVTCRAGQSRSVAVAYVLACHFLGTSTALELLDPTRHVPNQWVIRESTLCLDRPEIEEAFERWRTHNAHIKVSDYYNEIEDEVQSLIDAGVSNHVSRE